MRTVGEAKTIERCNAPRGRGECTDACELLQTAPTLGCLSPRVLSLPPIEHAEFKAVAGNAHVYRVSGSQGGQTFGGYAVVILGE